MCMHATQLTALLDSLTSHSLLNTSASNAARKMQMHREVKAAANAMQEEEWGIAFRQGTLIRFARHIVAEASCLGG